MSLAFPGESAAYRAARDRLLQQEIELRRATEAVAASRRALPPGGAIQEDYIFQGAGPDGTPRDVRLSALFAPGRDSLVISSTPHLIPDRILATSVPWSRSGTYSTSPPRGARPAGRSK